MKRASISQEQTDLNIKHLNESSASLESDKLFTPAAKKQSIKLRGLKIQILSFDRIINIVILILGNIAIILLLIFIYYSL